jgi:hypothetical protein
MGSGEGPRHRTRLHFRDDGCHERLRGIRPASTGEGQHPDRGPHRIPGERLRSRILFGPCQLEFPVDSPGPSRLRCGGCGTSRLDHHGGETRAQPLRHQRRRGRGSSAPGPGRLGRGRLVLKRRRGSALRPGGFHLGPPVLRHTFLGTIGWRLRSVGMRRRPGRSTRTVRLGADTGDGGGRSVVARRPVRELRVVPDRRRDTTADGQAIPGNPRRKRAGRSSRSTSSHPALQTHWAPGSGGRNVRRLWATRRPPGQDLQGPTSTCRPSTTGSFRAPAGCWPSLACPVSTHAAPCSRPRHPPARTEPSRSCQSWS